MAEVVELWEQFRKGKVTRGGRPLPPDELPPVEEVVTLVTHGAIDDFLGTRTIGERTAHLRRLRDDGLLIHRPGRLYQDVRGQGVRSAYVFRCQAHDVPRAEPAKPRRPRKAGRLGEARTV